MTRFNIGHIVECFEDISFSDGSKHCKGNTYRVCSETASYYNVCHRSYSLIPEIDWFIVKTEIYEVDTVFGPSVCHGPHNSFEEALAVLKKELKLVGVELSSTQNRELSNGEPVQFKYTVLHNGNELAREFSINILHQTPLRGSLLLGPKLHEECDNGR